MYPLMTLLMIIFPQADIFVDTETGLLTSTSPTRRLLLGTPGLPEDTDVMHRLLSALNNAVGNTALAMDTTNTDIDTLVDNYVKRNIYLYCCGPALI